MNQPTDGELADYHRKKRTDRQERKQSEKQAKRDLDALSTAAIEAALELAPQVFQSRNAAAIDLEIHGHDAATFVRKRVNEALRADEWLDVLRTWIWDGSKHRHAPLSDAGRACGLELRIERSATS